MAAAPPLHFVVPVWGTAYVRTFLDYCLPAQLSPQNIPALATKSDHRYVIYTTRADREQFEAAPSFRALHRFISVEMKYLDSLLSGCDDKYRIKSECYRECLQSAAEGQAAVLSLNADILLANGFVHSALEILSSGKRVIEVPGPRALRDPLAVALTAFRGPDGISISIEPDELSKLWVANLHPQLQMHYVDGPEGGVFHPSHLYWLVGQEGAIIRGFHLYPIVVDPRNTTISFSSTIDDDLVANLRLSKNELFLAQDSRTMFCCEMSPPDHYVGQMARRGDLARYVDFYLSYARTNIRNLTREIIVTGVHDLGPQWHTRRAQSERFTRLLLKQFNRERRRRTLQKIRGRLRAAIGLG